MQKLNIVVTVLCIVFLIVNIVQFIMWRNINETTTDTLTTEVTELQSQLATFGTPTTVYTVLAPKKAGDLIKDDDIVSLTAYSSLVTDQYIVDIESVIGKYYKIAVEPGTALTKNMVMDEALDDSMRDRDVVLDRLTVGLEEGDYIDVRMTMPYGDDYVVLSHKRVYGINDETIKLYLTELEWNIYQGALVDYFLNQAYGCTLYADRYIEPGLQQDAVNFYAVPDNIAALLQKNPNIIDKKEASSLNEWRKSIEELLVIFRDEDDTVDSDGATLANGRQDINDRVNSDYQVVRDEKAEQAAIDAENAAMNGETVDDSFWEDTP